MILCILRFTNVACIGKAIWCFEYDTSFSKSDKKLDCNFIFYDFENLFRKDESTMLLIDRSFPVNILLSRRISLQINWRNSIPEANQSRIVECWRLIFLQRGVPISSQLACYRTFAVCNELCELLGKCMKVFRKQRMTTIPSWKSF